LKSKTPRIGASLSLGEVMQNAIRCDGRETSLLRRIYVFGLWEDVVGKSVASRTEQLYLKDKKLFVTLRSSEARHELLMLRNDIMQRINARAKTQLVIEIILR
jgi:predicted nucleic acid-binding Zn ribbon protein